MITLVAVPSVLAIIALILWLATISLSNTLVFIAFSAAVTLGTVILWIASLFFTYSQRKKYKISFVLIAGLVVGALSAFLPLCAKDVALTSPPAFETGFLNLVSALHSTVRLFVIDGDYQTILNFSSETLNGGWVHLYNAIAGILHIACPLLTARGIVSLFYNFTAYLRYYAGFFKDAYVFSDLNDRSIKLARDLKKKSPKRMIIFTDVFKVNDEESYELIEQAQELDAILFKNDITVIDFHFHSPATKLYFFIIGEDDSENINQTIYLSKPSVKKKAQALLGYKTDYAPSGYDYKRKGGDTRIYLFTIHSSSEQLLSSITPQFLKLRRVNDVQSLVYKLLYDEGHYIFQSATESGNMLSHPLTGEPVPEKLISAVVIGLGFHGTEVLKALPWFCQLYPYRVEITAFDKDKSAESRFTSQCPELMSEEHNGDFDTDGEAHYKITINPEMPDGCNVNSSEFDRAIEKLENTTYVIVALGNDDLNVQVAAKIRILLKRKGKHPFIHAIVYNPDKQSLLQKGSIATGIMYDIHPTGDTSINFSEDCIINSKLEKEAEGRHLAWAHTDEEKEAFWKYDYNYRSSIAAVIHKKFKNKCDFYLGDDKDGTPLYYHHEGVPGADLPKEERQDPKYEYLGKMEHQRWNAYVRSEGYVLPLEGFTRDKLAKTHHHLRPFDELTPEVKANDIDSF